MYRWRSNNTPCSFWTRPPIMTTSRTPLIYSRTVLFDPDLRGFDHAIIPFEAVLCWRRAYPGALWAYGFTEIRYRGGEAGKRLRPALWRSVAAAGLSVRRADAGEPKGAAHSLFLFYGAKLHLGIHGGNDTCLCQRRHCRRTRRRTDQGRVAV